MGSGYTWCSLARHYSNGTRFFFWVVFVRFKHSNCFVDADIAWTRVQCRDLVTDLSVGTDGTVVVVTLKNIAYKYNDVRRGKTRWFKFHFLQIFTSLETWTVIGSNIKTVSVLDANRMMAVTVGGDVICFKKTTDVVSLFSVLDCC